MIVYDSDEENKILHERTGGNIYVTRLVWGCDSDNSRDIVTLEFEHNPDEIPQGSHDDVNRAEYRYRLDAMDALKLRDILIDMLGLGGMPK